MGEHQDNDIARFHALRAKQEPAREGGSIDLGDGLACFGVSLIPMRDEAGNLRVLIGAVVGKPSALMPKAKVDTVVFGQLASVPIDDLKKMLAEAANPPAEPSEVS